jgi:hypothetical protein
MPQPFNASNVMATVRMLLLPLLLLAHAYNMQLSQHYQPSFLQAV